MESFTILSDYLGKIQAAMFLVASIFAIVGLCAWHGHKGGEQTPKEDSGLPLRSPSPLGSPGEKVKNITKKALLRMCMKPPQAECSSGDALWKKPIIMGERCKALQFSGAIYYDTEGNQLPRPSRSSRATSPLRLPVSNPSPLKNEGK